MPTRATDTAARTRANGAGRFAIASRVRELSSLIEKAQVVSDTSLVLKIIAGGTLFVMGAISGLLALSFLIGNHYVLPRLIIALVFLAYAVTASVLVHRGFKWAATVMILIFYAVVGTLILVLWGLNVAAGELILGTVIVLAGILIGARSIFVTAGTVLAAMAAVQMMIATGVLRPDTRTLGEPSTFIDLAAYGAIFVFIAVVSWLSGRRMEQSLAKALQAEADLQAQKDLLEVRLEERTRSLREAQLEEMRQLYRFAELGQLGTVVLHDLANNLTVLTLDIDDIEAQTRSSEALGRARESIAYLDNMVAGARRQLRRNDKPVVFDALGLFDETVIGMRTKAARANVTIRVSRTFERPRFTMIGDPLRFTQILTILVTNAIEAYADTPRTGAHPPEVEVGLSAFRNTLQITVTDRGAGFSEDRRKLIFEPFHSTKPNGMGIGLFIAREIVERHFKGSISLGTQRRVTRFVVRIPEYHGK